MLKYASTPQLKYGNDEQSRLRILVPAGTHPIATANEYTATPVVLYENSGKSCWGLFHNGSWRRMAPFKDSQSGAVQWRMDGTLVNPVAWSPQPLQRKR